MDLWCFHQDYHSHYTTLYSHVRTKDSCRIRRMPPPALSLLTILLLHLGRIHKASSHRSITVFSCSVGNTFPCLLKKEPIIFLDKILIDFNQSSQPRWKMGLPLPSCFLLRSLDAPPSYFRTPLCYLLYSS